MTSEPAISYEHRPCRTCGAMTDAMAEARCQKIDRGAGMQCVEDAKICANGTLRFPSPLYLEQIADACEGQLRTAMEGFTP